MLAIIVAGTAFFSALGFFTIQKTPLFLLSRRKFKEFKKVMKYTAKLNKKKLDESFEDYEENILEQEKLLNESFDEEKIKSTLDNETAHENTETKLLLEEKGKQINSLS